MTINFWTLFTIFVLLIAADKVITMTNIILVNKNFPDAMKEDEYKIEKNPVAKWFFKKFGLVPGTILFGIVSIPLMFLAFWLFKISFNESTALYIVMMLMGLIIINNVYFSLKYAGVIP